MRPLDPDRLVTLWERAEGEPPLERAVSILDAMDPGPGREAIAAWPLAYRDRCLFLAHAVQYGPRIEVRGRCGSCGTGIELAFVTEDLLSEDPARSEAAPSMLTHCGRRLLVRPPTSRDLLAVADLADPGRALLTQLVDQVEDGDGAAPSWPGTLAGILDGPAGAELTEAIEAHLRETQPLSEVMINARCPDCGTETPHLFDILDHVWRRIAAEARRLLWDVHLLARAYGWSGAEILALSPARRRRHIAMVLG